MEHATAHRLAQEIRQSEEYQTYHALKEEIMADETTAALLKEYKKLQLRLQMAAQPVPAGGNAFAAGSGGHSAHHHRRGGH